MRPRLPVTVLEGFGLPAGEEWKRREYAITVCLPAGPTAQDATLPLPCQDAGIPPAAAPPRRAK